MAQLRKLYRKHGNLNATIIKESDSVPSITLYYSRFGGLVPAYELIGFKSKHDLRYVKTNKYLRGLRIKLRNNIIKTITDYGSTVEEHKNTKVITINGNFTIKINLARHFETAAGNSRWDILFDKENLTDLIVVARMNSKNDDILDYYLFPRSEVPIPRSKLRLSEINNSKIDAYRFDNLNKLTELSKNFTQGDVQLSQPVAHYTVEELAKYWNCSMAHVYNLIKDGKLNHISLGRMIRISKSQFETYELQTTLKRILDEDDE
ncbi:MAG: helix-turn-helix domain-containing protein [Emcibacteraceae bacterium]|nr:helix-turn-helix domain-containing protein [Emcibacteraceae bacterium]